jgi:hypothetical protein
VELKVLFFVWLRGIYKNKFYLYREHHGGVASIVAFTSIRNIPGQNTDPSLTILIRVS